MGTDLATVLEKMKAFELEAKYWFECIGINPPHKFEADIAMMKGFLTELGMYKGDGVGTGRGGEGEPK